MPRKDSSTPDPFADLDLTSEEKTEEKPETEAPSTPEQSVPEVPEVKASEPDAPVKIAFDPEYAVDDRVEEVVVSVGSSALVTLPVDGTAVEVSAEEADLLVQNPAVKAAE